MRAPVGATTRGAQHAQSLEGFFTHVPGLKVICPATAYDAVGLLRTAVHDDDPVIMFEHKKLYGSKGNRAEKGALSPIGEVPEEYYTIPYASAAVRREGTDVTIVANLLMMYNSLVAAEKLEEDGIKCEVIDPRTLVPFDYDTVYRSIEKTGRLAIVHEDVERNGWGAELAAKVAQEAIYALDAPVRRICTKNVPIPFAPVMEDYVVPSVERIVLEIKELMKQ
jgi:pyruvate dehydrogenase E1 component beta subunit